MYSKKKDTFTILELAILSIFSNHQEVNFEEYMDIDFEECAKASDYFYILKNKDIFIMIGSSDILIDKKIVVDKKIKIEDEISNIASSLKE